MKIRCIKPSSSLTANRIYHVLEISFDRQCGLMFRLLGDDKITPALHDIGQFELVSNKIPEEWCAISPKASLFKLTPKAWMKDNFWEDYFNGEPEAEKLFNEVAKKIVTDEPLDDPDKPSFFPPWSPF